MIKNIPSIPPSLPFFWWWGFSPTIFVERKHNGSGLRRGVTFLFMSMVETGHDHGAFNFYKVSSPGSETRPSSGTLFYRWNCVIKFCIYI